MAFNMFNTSITTKAYEQVSFTKHQNYRLLDGIDESVIKSLNMVPVCINELAPCAEHFPITIVKDQENGSFKLVALLGFNSGENLYWKNQQWHNKYQPFHLQHQPFYLGFDDRVAKNEKAKAERILCLDKTSKRLVNTKQGTTKGQPLYNTDASQSNCLIDAQQVLIKLEQGLVLNNHFINMALDMKLLKPLQLAITWNNQQEQNITGLYAIDPNQLQSLSTSEYQCLEKHHYLTIIQLINNSLLHINELIEIKNKLDA